MAILATLSLAAALACGGTVVGCGSSSGSNNPGVDSGTGGDTGSPKTDSGTPDTGTPADTGTPPVDSGVPDTHVAAALDAPTFAPGAGAVTAGTTVTISAGANQPADGQIYYTTDGTVPVPPSHGSLYVGPVQINLAETLIAVAHDPSAVFNDSPPASAIYTIVQPEAGTLGPVQFNPTAVAENNDFLVQLSDSPGATICYTLDGSTPACNAATGACTGTSQTYVANTQVSINGTVTDVVQGTVMVQAIACEAGETPSAPASQNYQLTVADPQMTINGAIVPPGTGIQNVPWNAAQAGIQDTLSTGTFNSITPPNAVALWWSTTGAPSCSTGSTSGSPKTLTQTTNGTTQVIGCKTGYHQSNIVSYPVTIQLNAPAVLAGGTFHYEPTISWAGVGNANAGIDDSANVGSGDVLCATLTGTPVCGTVPGGAATCTTGSWPLAGGTAGATNPNPSLTIGNKTSSTTTVTIVACAPTGLNTSTQGTPQKYTLQFASGFAYTTANLVSPATDLPGWDWSASGTPNTSMHIPATANVTAPGYPYAGAAGSFVADVVQPGPCVNTTTNSTATGIPTACTGAPTNTEPDYFCSSNTATVATCGCTAANQTAAAAALLAANAGVTTAAGANVLSLIPCQLAAGTATPNGYVFASPAATSITFSAANTALAPTVSAQVGAPQSVQATVTVTNNDTTAGGSQLCLNFGAGAGAAPANPTCTTGGCTTGEWCWSSTAGNGWVKSTGNGGNCALVPTPATLPAGSNVVTISPGPTTGVPGAPNGPGLVQTDGEVILAVACNTVELTSPVSPSETYAFTAAEPDFTSAAGEAANPAKIGDLNTATSIGAGAVVNLSTTSNFDLPNPPATVAMTIHYSTTGTATCGSPGVVTVASVTEPGGAGKAVISSWPVNGANPVAPLTGTTWTLSAVACGQNDGVLQQLSTPRTIPFNLTAAAPVLTTNQDGPKATGTCSATVATCGTTGQLPCCCTNSATPTCVAASPWESTFNAYLTSTTPGASICYSTGSIATCSAGTCSGTSVASPATIPLNQSGETLSYIGCLPGLTASSATAQSFAVTLNADQGYAGAGGAASCNATTKVGNSNLTADLALGAPTLNSCVCWTTDNTAPSCQANAAGCTGTPTGTTTCQSTGVAGTTQSGNITLTGTTTFNFKSCAQGFNPTISSQVYQLTPYRTTGIIVDGNLNDWNKGADTASTGFPPAGEAYGTEASYTIDMAWYNFATNNQADPFLAGKGMVTYSSTTLYVGMEASILNASNYPAQCYTPTNGACSPALHSYDVVYVGNGVQATGAGTDLPQLDTIYEAGCSYTVVSPNRTMATGGGIQYALLYRSDGGVAAPVAYAWNPGSQIWAVTTLAGVTAGFNSGTNTTEFGIPLASIGASATSTVTVFGGEIADVGQAGPPNGGSPVCGNSDELYRFPLAYPSDPAYFDLYQSFYEVNLANCNAPNTQIIYIP